VKFVHALIFPFIRAFILTLLWTIPLKVSATDIPDSGIIKMHEGTADPKDDWGTKDLIRQISSPVANDPETVREAIEAHEKAIHVFETWMRDPYITIGPDDKYYLTCTQFNHDSGRVGFPMWSSDDLVTWDYLGVPFSLRNLSYYEDSLTEAVNSGETEADIKLWAPEIHHENGKWPLVHTSNMGIGSLAISDSHSFKAPANLQDVAWATVRYSRISKAASG
jgi:arylsulfatase